MSATPIPTLAASTPRRPDRPVVGPSGYPLPLPGWDGLAVTARIPAPVVPTLRRVRVGDEMCVSLAIEEHDVAPAYIGADRWRTDEHGLLDARGTVRRASPTAPACRPAVLEVAGRCWPLGSSYLRPDQRLEISGVLVVRDHDDRTDPSRRGRRWTVRALRRYVARHGDLVAVSAPSIPDDAGSRDPWVVDLGPLADTPRGRR